MYWVVAVLSLVWNSIGCTDFTMTVTRNPGYIARFTPEMIDWLDAAPAWALATWALGVWSALAGSLLLLVRSQWAVAFFALSLIGLAGNQIWQFESEMPESMVTPASVAISVVIWIVAAGLLWFAIRMRARSFLR